MTHDPLCPMRAFIEAASEDARAKNASGTPVTQTHYEGENPFHTDEENDYCRCDLIAKIREEGRVWP